MVGKEAEPRVEIVACGRVVRRDQVPDREAVSLADRGVRALAGLAARQVEAQEPWRASSSVHRKFMFLICIKAMPS